MIRVLISDTDFERIIEQNEYNHYLEIIGRLEVEEFERAGYED